MLKWGKGNLTLEPWVEGFVGFGIPAHALTGDHLLDEDGLCWCEPTEYEDGYWLHKEVH